MKKRLLWLTACLLASVGLVAQDITYLRGDVNGWLNDADPASIDQQWVGTSTDGNVYIWDWSALDAEKKTIGGTFKLADLDWGRINYGPGTDTDISANTLMQVYKSSGGNFVGVDGLAIDQIVLNCSASTVTFIVNGQQGGSNTAIYIRGGVNDWNNMGEGDEGTTVNGIVYVWDWSAAPREVSESFKLAAVTENNGWDETCNYGAANENPLQLSDDGTCTVSLLNSNSSSNITLGSGVSWTVSRIELNRATQQAIITTVVEEEPEPVGPVMLTAEDIAVLWGEPVYNPDTKELQMSCTFDIATTQTAVTTDDLLAANPVCFIRFGASGDITASRDGNALTATISNVEAGVEAAYSLAMNIGADNAAVISATRIEISNSEWLYSPGTTTEPEPEISTLYLIGDATQGGWALENATALTYDTENNKFTWTGDLTVGIEGFKFIVSNTSWAPAFVAASADQIVTFGEPISLVYRENEEEGAPADFKFKVPADGNYTIEVVVSGNSATMTITQNSVVPVPEWYVAGNGTEGIPEWVNGKNWNPDGAVMSDNGDGTFTYSTTVPAGTYEFKITQGTWEGTIYEYGNVDAASSTAGYEDNGGNISFTVLETAEISIKLNPSAADNAKITLTSSVEFGYPEITMWTVTGDAILCGTDWDPTDESNDMAEGSETPGVWTKAYENFEVTAENAGTEISFKAVANHNYSIGEYPQGEGNNASLTLPAEAGTYNITITLNTNDWSISNSIEKIGGEEPVPAVELYFRGDIAGCGWYDGITTADEAGIDPKWKGATEDGKIYTWDWSAEPITISDGNQFKIGPFVAGDWASQAYGIAGGAAFAVGEAFAVEIPGGNIAVSGEYVIASATLDTEAGTLLLVEASAEEPEVETLYIRGSFNNYLQDAIDPASKWAAVPDENGNYIWDWTGLTDEERTIIGEFKIANEDYSIKYGAQQDDQMQIPADLVLGQATGVFDSEKNFNLPQNTKVSKVTLNTTDYTLTVEGEVVVEPETDPLMLYGGVFGTDASVETYLVNSVDGVYTWNFGEGLDVAGWFLIVGRIQGEDGFYTQNWDTKVGSSEQLSLAGGLQTATIKVDRNSNAGNIVVSGTLKVTEMIYDSNAGQLTVNGSESAEAGEVKLYFKGDVNDWFQNVPESEISAQWLAEETEDGIFVWDWSGLDQESATVSGAFKISDYYYNIQYGGESYGAEFELGVATSVVSINAQDMKFSTPVVISKITLNTNDNTLLIEGEEVVPDPTPIMPTADSYVVEWNAQYDAESATVTLTAVVSAAADAGFSLDQITGMQAEIIIDDEQTSARLDLNAANAYTATRVIEGVQSGQTINYSIRIVTGANDYVSGSDVPGVSSGTYTVSAEEPEPAAKWYIAGDGTAENNWCCGKDWDPAGCALSDNGDGTYTYIATVQAGTYNFKITNGKWYNETETPDGINYGYSNINATASTSGYEDGGGNNAQFTVAEEAEITIVLNENAEENAKITLTSSVAFGEKPETEITVWTLFGDERFFGTNWDINDTNNDMVQDSENQYIWTKTYENVEVSELVGATILYKAVANHDYAAGEFPMGYGVNEELVMPAEAGTYNFTFTFDTQIWDMSYKYEKVGGGDPEPIVSNLYLVGDVNSWTPDAEWLGQTTSGSNVIVWQFEEPVAVTGGFKIAAIDWVVDAENPDGHWVWDDTQNYGVNEGFSPIMSVDQLEDIIMINGSWSQNIAVAEGYTMNVSAVEFDVNALTLNIIGTVDENQPTAIDEVEAAIISASNGRIYCDKDFVILNLAGQDVTSSNGNLQGTYIVLVGDQAVKVLVD